VVRCLSLLVVVLLRRVWVLGRLCWLWSRRLGRGVRLLRLGLVLTLIIMVKVEGVSFGLLNGQGMGVGVLITRPLRIVPA
jgi:hypothetical protein